ncbi:MAG: hypothetical protein JWL59_4457 [Chthoniobacteraceae bacterium]|nr:hypothetical protein [Chthoniobacteraceae bacterium]
MNPNSLIRTSLPGIRWLCVLFAFCFHAAPAGAGSLTEAADYFYEPKSVQTIHLEVKPDDLDRLRRALPRRIHVPCTFRWNNQTIEHVSLRYKGNSSSSPDSPYKRGLLIDFSEFQEGQRFLGLRHVALDNGIQFGSLFSERLITDVLREAGVKASRCNYARVYLNGNYTGVYVNVERIDKTFLQRNFNTDRGPLFKVDEGGPGADLRYLGSDLALYQKTFELHGGKEAYPQLLEFIRLINAPVVSEEELRRSLDVEAYIKTTAILLFAGAFDQYTGWQPHNYYLYRNPADQRWSYIPWDLDVGFADHAFGRIPVLDGWHAAWPVPIARRPLTELIVSDPAILNHYRTQASVLLESYFRPEVLIPKLRALYDQIGSDLAKDPHPPRRATVPSDTGYQEILASMETFIRQRYLLARAQLDTPGARPEGKQPGSDQKGPTPGPPSADAPSELRVVKVTASGVELCWMNRSPDAMAFVVQRCTGEDDFANVIGQGGHDVTTASDRDVRPGKIYRYRVYAVRPTPQGPSGTGVSNVVTVRLPED